MRFISISLMALFLTACATGPSEPYRHQINGTHFTYKTSDLQSAYMKENSNPVRYCADRMADVADSRDVKFGIGFGAEETSDGAGESAVGLGGRNPAVLITRELLYRACEISINHNLSKEETLEVYYRFLNAAIDISKTQTSQGTASDNAVNDNNAKSSTSTEGQETGDGWSNNYIE